MRFAEIRGLHFKLVQFSNTSHLTYRTNGLYFILLLRIKEPINSPRCALKVIGNLMWSRTRNVYGEPHEMAARSPFISWGDPLPEQPSYNYNFISDKTTWSEASNHCQEIGGHLFVLDSYDQQVIMMDNVRPRYWEDYNKFWLSSLIFIGIPHYEPVSHTIPYICILIVDLKAKEVLMYSWVRSP
jgi:hypothetical protein